MKRAVVASRHELQVSPQTRAIEIADHRIDGFHQAIGTTS